MNFQLDVSALGISCQTCSTALKPRSTKLRLLFQHPSTNQFNGIEQNRTDGVQRDGRVYNSIRDDSRGTTY